MLRQTADCARVENQHRTLAGFTLRTTRDNSPHKGLGASSLSGRGPTYLTRQRRRVSMARSDQLAPPHLGANSVLQQLGGW